MLYPKPRICTFNLDNSLISALKKRYDDVFEGSFSCIYRNVEYHTYPPALSVQYEFPDNIHEYDVFILDLQHSEVKDFFFVDIDRVDCVFTMGKDVGSEVDARVGALKFFNEEIKEIYKPILVIILCGTYNQYQYYVGGQNTPIKFNTFPFSDLDNLGKIDRGGIEVVSRKDATSLDYLFQKYLPKVTYDMSFSIPYVLTDSSPKRRIEDPTYSIYLRNSNGQMISFKKKIDDKTYLIFPRIQNKKDFLLEFIDNVANQDFSEFFPVSITNSWINNAPYISISEELLIRQKKEIIEKYENDIAAINDTIEKERERDKFMSDILIETGDNLVVAVSEVLKKLPFKNVEISDKLAADKILEEDLEINLANEHQILAEVKGIYGTSTDSDCSQIYKVVNRRREAMKRFDITGIYIVNHQRGIPPIKRRNPPFSLNQIRDAEIDNRGLLTTWELFKAMRLYENGLLSFDHFIVSLTNPGLITFLPDKIINIGIVKEYFAKVNAAIINITSPVEAGDEIFYIENEIYEQMIIESIRIDDHSVEAASDCEVGIVFSRKVAKGSILYKKKKE